ncbi:alpha-L-rhamnosidase [Emticicia agri]|uniref:alpha-L-rhamnosidase n=1 Tax=Emticicia agri TaxID=2492393 RepID=A0A4Q5M046_9BACT|nr:alpha-L-rhamnosidase [Emticicia agri]RYU95636.1 hypothetical protein EWM59_11020 [Emticicia agri]
MKKLVFSLFAILVVNLTYAQTIEKLRCEYFDNPLGLDTQKPRLSWQMVSGTRGAKQTAYQILVADTEENLKKDNGNVWNSGMVKSDQSLWITYAGKALESRKRYFWKVKVWNDKNKPTAYSPTSWWEMGLLQPSDWSAHWIGKKGTEGKPPKAVELQKEFSLAKRAVRARIYVTGLGAYHLIFNGKKVGQDILTPGWTHYLKTIHYQTYEIDGEDLTIGTNFITATLGNGWWSSGLGWGGGKFAYSEGPCRLLFQMELEFYDGSRQTVISDETWKTRLSPIVSNSLYNGEVYDGRLEYGKDWENATILDDAENKTTLFGPKPEDNRNDEAETFSTKNTKLIASVVPQIQVMQELKAVKITEPRKGHYVFDFGQNLVGFTHLKVEGKAGKEVEMKFAELLTDKGLADQANLRSIRPTDKYILKGYGVEEWEPKFTYHGFRYLEVEGLPKKPDENTLVAKVIHNNVPFSGSFTTSNDLLNSIYKNITWGQHGNMHSVPTDCPQRDERLGWMGDAQIFAPTASYIMQMNGFFAKWVRDIADSQHSSGYVYDVNPKIVVGGPSKPAWGDAIVIVPYRMYQFYGDKRIIEENYEAMKNWVEYMNNHPNTKIDGIYYFQAGDFYGYGDWVPVENSPTKPIGGSYQFYSNKLLAEMAKVIGKTADSQKYTDVAQKVADKYNEVYFDPQGKSYEGNTQGANLIPLSLGITKPADRLAVAQNVAANVRAKNDHLTTGFLSTAMLLPALSDAGEHELAYKVAIQKTYPSWGYMIEKGATTMWELWNSDTEKPEGMNSRNHFAYGSIGEWFYSYLGGIKLDPLSAGFKHFMIAPMPVGDLKWVESKYESSYGPIASGWNWQGAKFVLKVSIPANASAQIQLPLSGKTNAIVKESEKLILSGNKASKAKIPGITFVKIENNKAIFEVLSGNYTFSVE